MSDRDKRLTQFFGCNFHQDWDCDGAESWADVMAQYARENPRTSLTTLRDDLRSWVGESGPGPSLFDFQCDYDPRLLGIDERAWVTLLVAYLEKELTRGAPT